MSRSGAHKYIAIASGDSGIAWSEKCTGEREAIWQASRIDHTWQERKWGADEEEQKGTAAKHRDFLHAGHFWDLSRPRA